MYGCFESTYILIATKILTFSLIVILEQAHAVTQQCVHVLERASLP